MIEKRDNTPKIGTGNATKWMLALMIVLVLALSLTIAGCAPAGNQAPPSSQNQAPGAARGRGMNGNSSYGSGMRGNLTTEQRQQMMAQRLQQEKDACNGMAEGDTCTLTNTRGNMTGICKTLNETLACSVSFGGRPAPGN